MVDVDSDETFQHLLAELHVPEAFLRELSNAGIASIADFASAYDSPAQLSFLARIAQSTWDEMQVAEPERSPQVARLRRALDRCKTLTQLHESTMIGTAPHSSPGSAMSQSATQPNV